MIKIYDHSISASKPVAILTNAFDVGYSKRLNEIWTAQFSLAADDEKNTECLAFRFVEIFDGDERVDLFRILPNNFDKSADGKAITYSCEHVLSTLLDDLLFQYNQITGFNIMGNVQFVLSKQSSVRWIAGFTHFSDIFDYKWENENLLSALFSIPKALTGNYQWTWDTSGFPWILNLIAAPVVPTSQIRYKKNLIGIKKTEDPSYIITRLYPLGYGEGINQLDIKKVNNGVPYINSSTIGTYGVIATTFIAKDEENAQTLFSKAKAYLETIKGPRISYTVDGADIYQITKDPIDRFRSVGDLVTVVDEDLGTFNARIVAVSKSDLTGAPGNISIEISNKILDIFDSTTQIESRQRISDVYAQGATNIDSNDYQDNCDNTHPATIKFYLPNETVRVNKCLLTYRTDKYRTYEVAIENGGSSTSQSGGNSTLTTAAYFPDGTVIHNPVQSPEFMDHYHRAASGHIHDISAHNHAIDYGIYEFPNLPPSLVIKVDGTTIPNSALSGSDVNIIPYLATSGGKITKGTFHTIEIFPNVNGGNPKGLSRITACVIKQIFIQSRGGGDY